VLNWYTVRRGESLATIARKLRVSKSDLAEANYLSTRSAVNAGQKLVIPRAPAVLMAAHPDRPVPVAESRPAVANASLVTEAPADDDDAPAAQSARVVYRVKKGDTLASIARLFKTSVASLKVWNHLASTRIAAGDRLTIYRSAAHSAQNR